MRSLTGAALSVVGLLGAVSLCDAQESFHLEDAVRRGYVEIVGTGRTNKLRLRFHRPCTVFIKKGTVVRGSQAMSIPRNTAVTSWYVSNPLRMPPGCRGADVVAVASPDPGVGKIGSTSDGAATSLASATFGTTCIEADKDPAKDGRAVTIVTATEVSKIPHLHKMVTVSVVAAKVLDEKFSGLAAKAIAEGKIPAGVDLQAFRETVEQYLTWNVANRVKDGTDPQGGKRVVNEANIAAGFIQEFTKQNGKAPSDRELTTIKNKAAVTWDMTNTLTADVKKRLGE